MKLGEQRLRQFGQVISSRVLSAFFFFKKFTFFYLFIYLFMTVLSLRFCARAPSSCGKRGPLLIAVRGPLTIAASPVAEHRLQTHRPSNCGSRAQPLRGTRDPPRPGIEPTSPAPAGRLPTTAPPGKLLSAFITFHVWSPFSGTRLASILGCNGILSIPDSSY